MYATKPYKFIGFGAMDATKPYKSIGFGAMDATKPYKFIGFGPRPLKFDFMGAHLADEVGEMSSQGGFRGRGQIPLAQQCRPDFTVFFL